MPLFAALFVGMVQGIASFLVLFLTKKIAFGLAAVASLAVIVGVLLSAMRTAVTAINVTVSDPYILMGLGIGFPPNAPACIAAIATVWAACTLYAWQRKALDLFAKVS